MFGSFGSASAQPGHVAWQSNSAVNANARNGNIYFVNPVQNIHKATTHTHIYISTVCIYVHPWATSVSNMKFHLRFLSPFFLFHSSLPLPQIGCHIESPKWNVKEQNRQEKKKFDRINFNIRLDELMKQADENELQQQQRKKNISNV